MLCFERAKSPQVCRRSWTLILVQLGSFVLSILHVGPYYTDALRKFCVTRDASTDLTLIERDNSYKPFEMLFETLWAQTNGWTCNVGSCFPIAYCIAYGHIVSDLWLYTKCISRSVSTNSLLDINTGCIHIAISVYIVWEICTCMTTMSVYWLN